MTAARRGTPAGSVQDLHRNWAGMECSKPELQNHEFTPGGVLTLFFSTIFEVTPLVCPNYSTKTLKSGIGFYPCGENRMMCPNPTE